MKQKDSQQHTDNQWQSLWLVLLVWLITYCWHLIYWRTWYDYNGIAISTLTLVLLGFLDWSFWLLALPLTLWVARRYPPVELRFALLIHLPFSLLCTIGALAGSSLARVLIEPVDQQFSGLLTSRLYSEGSWYFQFYWFVIGAFFAIDYFKAYRQSELDTLHLQLDNEQLQRGLIEARLQTLKGQLQPHFLFNALHSVSALMDTNVPRARAMLIDLADLLRLALKISEKDTHTLADEFSWLEKYLKLEGIRFAGQLEWHLTLDPQLAEYEVPCLIIQPLVENALKHGVKGSVSQRQQGFIIGVTAEINDNTIQLVVNDNGIGLPADSDWSEGYGLRYVRRAVTTHIDHPPEIALQNRPGGGVTASLKWPFQNTLQTSAHQHA